MKELMDWIRVNLLCEEDGLPPS